MSIFPLIDNIKLDNTTIIGVGVSVLAVWYVHIYDTEPFLWYGRPWMYW